MALYQQIIEDCLEQRVGKNGLSKQDLLEFTPSAMAIISKLKQDLADGTLPLLALAGREDDIPQIETIAKRYRETFSDVVILGTGGSSLGGQTLYALADSGFGPRRGGPKLHFIDNVDPDTFELMISQLELDKTGFIVISKSGSTAETIAQFVVCLEALMAKRGRSKSSAHALVITEPGTNPLRSLANRLNLHVLDHDPNIGGRFSVLSLVGMLPALIAGLDARAVRRGAQAVLDETFNATDPSQSPPAMGAIIKVAMLKKKNISNTVLMPYVDRLSPFALWFRQLWAESLGKNGSGSTPIRAMGTRDQHSQMQLYLDGPKDKIFTLILMNVAGKGRLISTALVKEDELSYLEGSHMGDLLDAEQRATAITLVKNGCPLRLFMLDKIDEEVLGGLLMHFMLETIIAAGLLGVNAFDQPAVEEGKILTREFLSANRNK